MVAIHSEIGRLRKVIVHAPGPELLAVTPENRTDFLYDDIIDAESALDEHRRFTALLERFATVYDARTLLVETLAHQEAREFLLKRSEEVTANKTLRRQLATFAPEELAERYIEGWRLPSGPFATTLENESYALPPLPNLFFTRDASVVVGDKVVISTMCFPSRWPEEALMRTIFGFHPEFGQPEILFDGSDERRHDYTLEGGDVHPLSEEVLLIGISERSSVAMVDELCELVFEKTKIVHVIGVVLPKRSTAIHLDMVWTQVDRQQCVAHPPMFRGANRCPVLLRSRGQSTVRQPDSLFDALKSVGLPMEPIWAGGERRETRLREQWASGCNFLAVAPGQVLSYARNDETLKALETAGFRVIDGARLLLGDERLGEDEKAVMTFMGSELVRGGGGPRCMSCPVQRDPL